MKLYGRRNKLSETDDAKASDSQIVPVKVAKSTGGKSREPASSLVLLCNAISKRKHYSHAGVKVIIETELERIAQLSKETSEMDFDRSSD